MQLKDRFAGSREQPGEIIYFPQFMASGDCLEPAVSLRI